MTDSYPPINLRFSFYAGIGLTLVGLGFSLASAYTAADLQQQSVILLLVAIILFQMDNKVSVASVSQNISQQGDSDE